MKNQLSLLLMLFLTALLPTTGRAQLTPHCFGLSISSVNGAPGDTVCVDIRTTDFSNVSFTFYSFQWDPEVLTYLGPTNLSLPNMDQANLTADLLAAYRLLLGLEAGSGEGSDWRFWRSDVIFYDPGAPWAGHTGGSPVIQLTGDVNGFDFIGYLPGDVDGSAIP